MIVHQLVERTTHKASKTCPEETVRASCGLLAHCGSHERTPDDFSGWASKVTCTECKA